MIVRMREGGNAQVASQEPSSPPRVPLLQLALRVLLEIAALIALGLWGRSLNPGWAGWLFALLFPIVAATAWGTFAVRGDPSRSGKAPVPVPGVLRLALELVVLFGGAAGLAASGYLIAAGVMAVLIALHH